MRPIDLERLKAIKQMLFSLAVGNFGDRIARTQEDDIIESISVLLNMMAEEMRETLQLYAELHTENSILNHNHIVIILNNTFTIVYISNDVYTEFGYEAEDLINTPITNLLSTSHLEIWEGIANSMVMTEEFKQQHPLMFSTKNGMERYCSCVITSMYDPASSSRYVILSIYEPVLQSTMVEDQLRKKLKDRKFVIDENIGPPSVISNQKDRKILKEIHYYLLQNLDKDFPGLQSLANKFGTNEYKLKYGFKQLYGNSVFRFFKEERLKKGLILLTDTELAIKSIAARCGYSNNSHFSKDFKLRYGVSPKDIR